MPKYNTNETAARKREQEFRRSMRGCVNHGGVYGGNDKQLARKLIALERTKAWAGSVVTEETSLVTGVLFRVYTHPSGAVARVNLTGCARALRKKST